MHDIKLLDCTLRDGGYVNDWEFGHSKIVSIFERLVDTRADIVEIGFIDDRRPFDVNRSIIPNTESIAKIYGKIRKRPPMIVGMIDYGTCALEHVQPCDESYVDGIRVIFKKHVMHEAMAYCAELKRLGYLVFSQLVSITSYSDDELIELIDLVNDVEPYAVSMVDTYGLLDPPGMLHYYELLDNNVNKNIRIGFHAHNNLQLAYANSRAFVDRRTDRDILVDGTLFGMGKSAGNAPIELVSMYLNQTYGKNYSINDMLEAIDESIMDFYKKTPWGYKTYFYLASYNRCHPNYVKQIQEKTNLSITDINNLLRRIEPQDTKLLYDKDALETIYNSFIKDTVDDAGEIEKLKKVLSNRKILILGPGRNIQLQKDRVDSFIVDSNPVVISINYIPGAFLTDYVFVTKTNRYSDMADDLLEVKNKDVKIIGTSNVTSRGDDFTFVFSREPLLEKSESIVDNSFLMLLNILHEAGINEVYCAGLDGYSDKEDNYFNPKMEYSFIKQEAHNLNRHIRQVINERYEDMNIEFITYSHYMDVEDSYDAAF